MKQSWVLQDNAIYSGDDIMSNLCKQLLILHIFQKYQKLLPQYKLIVECLFPLIVLTSGTMDPGWIYPYNTEKGASVNLEWYPNDEPYLTWYEIYSGIKNYLIKDVSLDIHYTITDLEPGKPYYTTATAYSVYSVESDFKKKSYTQSLLIYK